MDHLFHFFQTVRWQDLLDIALNSYILFRLYVLFRGTSAFRVLVGIAIFWISNKLALSLGLVVTSWVIQGITLVAAVIIVVIFRNEIRSVLQAKNLKSILWGFPRSGEGAPAEAVAEALFELAHNRTGALLILPGKEDLSEAVHSGIPWKGLVSKEMIMTVFWRDNPVHDGAAVVRDHQIDEVGVILPLSHRDDLPSFYGTRHRAALGLAERSDALVLVVSEERGTVSAARNSQMQEIKSREDLLGIIEMHTGATISWGRTGKDKFELSLAAVLSVFLIIAVWSTFTRGVDTVVSMDIPVEYMNRPPEMEILDTSVNAVRLEISGSGALLRRIQPEQVSVKLDLSKGVPGSNPFTITPESVSLPPGVLLKEVKPPVVDVTLDMTVKKDLPVQVDWIGKLQDPYVIAQVKIDPPRVQVSGSARVLSNVSAIYTEKISVDHINRSGTHSAKLVPSLPSLKLAQDKVTIEYLVKERTP
jgi:diadenylate cyclase